MAAPAVAAANTATAPRIPIVASDFPLIHRYEELPFARALKLTPRPVAADTRQQHPSGHSVPAARRPHTRNRERTLPDHSQRYSCARPARYDRAVIALGGSVAFRIGSFRFGGTGIVLAMLIALAAVSVVLWGLWLSRRPWRRRHHAITVDVPASGSDREHL